MHYKRVTKHGDPHYQPDTGAPLRWLLSHVSHAEDECLFWPFLRNNKGYAILTANGRGEYAHRLMCKEVNGPAPDGRPHALHSCGRGHLACIHPEHLYWGTHKQNMQDRTRHGTDNRGERQGCSKLTAAQVLRIRRIARSLPARKLAEMFGVTQGTINDIRHRRTWAWLETARK